MKELKRTIQDSILKDLLHSKKVIILYGARQVGKTTLARDIIASAPLKSISINGDLKDYNDAFASRNLNTYKDLIGDNELLFIDEAQNISDIGMALKIMHDNFKNLAILVTGSSSLEIASKVYEPLTGRTKTYTLYPIALQELSKVMTPFELKQKFDNYLRYGMYPEVIQTEGKNHKIELLRELAVSYLYKDVLQLSNIRHSDKLVKLLKLLAFQIGSLVSVQELSNKLQMSHDTVQHYIDLLEKGFIITRLSGYSKNLRKEISKMDKIYFNDLGVRNMLVENFNDMEWRTDIGALWENFVILERIKKMEYDRSFGSNYFWRTYTGAELDYVEEMDGQLTGYEIKHKAKKIRAPKTWLATYSNATYAMIHKDNILKYVL